MPWNLAGSCTDRCCVDLVCLRVRCRLSLDDGEAASDDVEEEAMVLKRYLGR